MDPVTNSCRASSLPFVWRGKLHSSFAHLNGLEEMDHFGQVCQNKLEREQTYAASGEQQDSSVDLP
jgi:hypothetical protein